MTDEEKILRANEAKQLLNNDIFKRVMNELDAEYHARWHEAVTVEAREDLHRYVKLTEKIVTDIQAIVAEGAFAQARKDQLEGKPQSISPEDFAKSWLTKTAA